MRADVPQRRVLGPILYLLYSSDLPSFDQNVATFVEVTLVLVNGDNNIDSTGELQITIDDIKHWKNVSRTNHCT